MKMKSPRIRGPVRLHLYPGVIGIGVNSAFLQFGRYDSLGPASVDENNDFSPDFNGKDDEAFPFMADSHFVGSAHSNTSRADVGRKLGFPRSQHRTHYPKWMG